MTQKQNHALIVLITWNGNVISCYIDPRTPIMLEEVPRYEKLANAGFVAAKPVYYFYRPACCSVASLESALFGTSHIKTIMLAVNMSDDEASDSLMLDIAAVRRILMPPIKGLPPHKQPLPNWYVEAENETAHDLLGTSLRLYFFGGKPGELDGAYIQSRDEM